MVIGCPRVRLNWCTADAHTVRLTGGDAARLDLLAIPPDTPTVLALTCLARAAREMPHPVGPGVPAGVPRPLRGAADDAGPRRRPSAGSSTVGW
jgi:hypothetical protein